MPVGLEVNDYDSGDGDDEDDDEEEAEFEFVRPSGRFASRGKILPADK